MKNVLAVFKNVKFMYFIYLHTSHCDEDPIYLNIWYIHIHIYKLFFLYIIVLPIPYTKFGIFDHIKKSTR